MLPGLSFTSEDALRPALGIRADRVAMVALTQRGPVETPTLVRGPDEFLATFGCPVDGMLGPLAAAGCFANGAEDLIVTRFVPIEAEAATTDLEVVHASQGLGYVVGVHARHRGAFGNDVRVRVRITARIRGKGTPTAQNAVHFDAPSAFGPRDVGAPARVLADGSEAWTTVAQVVDGLGGSQDVTLSQNALPAILPPTAIIEVYLRTFTLVIRDPILPQMVVDGLDLQDPEGTDERLRGTPLRLDFPAAPQAELPQPDVVSALSGGDDGLTLGGDVAALRASFERAVTALERSDRPSIVIAPDLQSRVFRTKGVERLALSAADAQALADRLVESAAVTRDRIVIVDPPLTASEPPRPLTSSELSTWREQREQTLGDARDFAACYTPWPRIVAGPVFQSDDTMLVPPSALVAGRMAQTARERGPWIATGAESLEQVVGLAHPLSQGDAVALQAVGINPLRGRMPQGSTIEGVRSLSWPDRPNWGFISTRGLFNFLRRALVPIGLRYVFEPHAPATYIALRRDLEGVLQRMHAAGAFAGSRPRDSYFVKIDDTLNPEPARDAGILTAQIGVAPAVPLEFLVVHLTVRDGLARVAEEPPVA